MIKIKIIFWNINGKNLKEQIIEILTTENPDILILAECENLDATIMDGYEMLKTNEFEFNASGKKKFEIYSKKNISCYRLEKNDTERFLINGVEIIRDGKKEQMLIVGLHLPSKLNGAEEQNDNSLILLNRIKQSSENLLERLKSEKIIYIGDFNLNPYEKPLNMELGLLTTNCPHAVAEVSKYKQKERLYYNPSYHFIGNLNKNVYGTYYYKHRWSVLDQIVMSKEVSDFFIKEKFEILLLKDTKLLKNNIPDRVISDHLPIRVEFDFNKVIEEEECQ